MHYLKRGVSCLLMLALLATMTSVGALPIWAEVRETQLNVAVVSDIHYYAQKDMGNKGEAWQAFEKTSNRQFEQTPAILASALQQVEDGEYDALLVSGDLTRNGEYNAHVELAETLLAFQTRTGIPVYTTVGNHDVNNPDALTFADDSKQPSRITTAADVKEIYKDLGYSRADSSYTPPSGKLANGLSYAADLGDDYRLIVLDSSKYSPDATSDGKDRNETGGNITDSLLQWALDECAKARKQGKTILGMMHHNFVPHFPIEAELFQDFPVDDWQTITEPLADAGMHFGFTGHTHMDKMSSHVNDNGEAFTDIMAASLSGFPNTFRTVAFTTQGEQITAKVASPDSVPLGTVVDVDGVAFNTRDELYRYAFSYNRTYGDTLQDFAMNAAGGMITDLFADVQEQGGLLNMLTNSGIDLEEILIGLLGEGLKLGPVDLLTVEKNLMPFLRDLCAQIDKKYINDPAYTLGILEERIADLLAFPVSDLPSTYFIDSLGFGDETKSSTLNDLGNHLLGHVYEGGVAEDDAMLMDAIAYFENGDGAENLFNHLRQVLITDLVQDELLANLNLKPSALFPAGTIGHGLGLLLEGFLTVVFFGNTSYQNILLSVLGILPLEFKNVNDIIDMFAGEYITQSQYDAWGWIIAYMIKGLVNDAAPANHGTVVYDGPVTAEATADNHRLPTNIAVTFGDTQADRNILWFTKYSVTGTDIEIIPYRENPQFTGKATTTFVKTAEEEPARRSYPGVDLGLIGFMDYDFPMIRHEISLTGLKPGEKYSFRIGDASRGWWSNPGVLDTAKEDAAFTFFHMTDSQAQIPGQYDTWANVVNQAYGQYPEGKFIMHTGDQVDLGTNFKHWKWFLNSTQEDHLGRVMMPTSGNHEDAGRVFWDNFLLSNTPKQDFEDGVMYSFDYNNAHFIVLNTNNLNDQDALSEYQLDWLKADAAASDKDWTIVALHKAMYSNGSHYDDSDVIAIREQLCGLLPDLGVDLVLQGHDHVYLRTDIMDHNQIVKAQETQVEYNGKAYTMKMEPQGTVYAITGCAGVKTYLTKDAKATDELFPRAEKLVEADLPFFAAITIDGSRLYFDAYTVDGDKTVRVDNFALDKAKSSQPTDPGNNEETPSTTTPDATTPGTATPGGTTPGGTQTPVSTQPATTGNSTGSGTENSTQAAGSATVPDTGHPAQYLWAALLPAFSGALLVLYVMQRRKKQQD